MRCMLQPLACTCYDLKDIILEAANSDQHYLQVKELLQQGNFQPKFKYYELKEDGFLMYRGKYMCLNLKR
jgi:hypothetical protein